jgi:hypothetical protein
MAVVDISNLSKSDQEAVREASRTGDYSKVSEEGLRIITDTAYDTSDVVFRQVERGLSSSTRGVARMFGLDPQSDQDAERQSRAMFETNPGTSWASYIGGSILDPINAIGVGKVKTALSAGMRFGALGGALGFIEPTYDEYEDSRLRNAAVGAGTLGLFGAGVTGLVNKIAGKSSQEVEKALTDEAQKSLTAATTTPSAVGPPKPLVGPMSPSGVGVTPENTFGPETSSLLSIDVTAYKPQERINLILPDGTQARLTQEQALKEGYITLKGLDAEAVFIPPTLPSYLKNAKPRYKNLVPTFESDLDKALYIIGKETGNRSKADDKYLEFVMQNTGLNEAAARAEGRRIIKEVGEKLKTADVDSDSVFTIPTTWKPNATRLPRPTVSSVEQVTINAKNLDESPKLSSKLFDEPIVHNGSKLIFGSDIDKAAVAVKKNSVNKQEYLDYVKNTFGINEQQAEKIIDEISSEVLNKVNKSAVTEGKLAPQTSVPMSATLDNIVNPVFKHMDDESRYVYNYSKSLGELDGKPKVRIDEGFKQFVAKMGQIFPGIKEVDAISTAQGYQRLMDNLKLEKGAKFTSTNIRDFAANRNGNLDAFIASAKRGDMDGCWS